MFVCVFVCICLCVYPCMHISMHQVICVEVREVLTFHHVSFKNWIQCISLDDKHIYPLSHLTGLFFGKNNLNHTIVPKDQDSIGLEKSLSYWMSSFVRYIISTTKEMPPLRVYSWILTSLFVFPVAFKHWYIGFYCLRITDRWLENIHMEWVHRI